MADLTTLRVPVPSDLILVIGTGGGGRKRAVYRDNKKTEEVVEREGSPVHRLSGVAVSIAGVGLDGAMVETSTPLETVEAGTIFRVEGAAELTVRADARPGFGDGGPRGVLAVSVYAQTLTAVGSVDQLLRGGSRRASSE